jgi:hypothetical protein
VGIVDFVKSLLLGPKTPKIILPSLAPPPSITDPEIDAAKKRAANQSRLAKGYASTLITGGQGDTSAAPSQLKTLMGA